MFTQAPAKKNSKPAPVAFVRRGDPEPSAVFIPGECICKECKSTDLRFVPYLEDAKCNQCDQWQNEPPLPM